MKSGRGKEGSASDQEQFRGGSGCPKVQRRSGEGQQEVWEEVRRRVRDLCREQGSERASERVSEQRQMKTSLVF